MGLLAQQVHKILGVVDVAHVGRSREALQVDRVLLEHEQVLPELGNIEGVIGLVGREREEFYLDFAFLHILGPPDAHVALVHGEGGVLTSEHEDAFVLLLGRDEQVVAQLKQFL